MFHDYVSKTDKLMMAAASGKKLEKALKRPLEPVILSSGKMAVSWWGIMWNKNLERYAEYESRIGRGKSYVKNGFVLDMQIEKGMVTAYVQGTRKAPYFVTIVIDPIKQEIFENIKRECQGKLDTLDELLGGKFSGELSDIFVKGGAGFFPDPREIRFRCTCPDWADCCKHVSATLYGIGSKLDTNPLLFFTLRSIDIDSFLSEVIQSKTSAVLNQGKCCESKRIIKNADVNHLFDIELDE